MGRRQKSGGRPSKPQKYNAHVHGKKLEKKSSSPSDLIQEQRRDQASTVEARRPEAISTHANENNPCTLPGAVKIKETTSIVEPQPPSDCILPDTPTTPQKEQPTVQPSSSCSTPRSSCSNASPSPEAVNADARESVERPSEDTNGLSGEDDLEVGSNSALHPPASEPATSSDAAPMPPTSASVSSLVEGMKAADVESTAEKPRRLTCIALWPLSCLQCWSPAPARPAVNMAVAAAVKMIAAASCPVSNLLLMRPACIMS